MLNTSTIHIIVGPTSSGKTSLSLDICRNFNGEIVSADSRQIYKYMDIGTGKLPVTNDYKIEKHDQYWIINGIKVWGYDLVTPDKFFSGYDFALFALNKAREIRDSGKNVFVVGGTGFYIDLFTQRVTPSNIEPDFGLRKDLEKLSLSELQEKLTSLNILDTEKIDMNNPVRLIRAIEKNLAGSKNFSPLPYFTNINFKYIGLKSSNDFLFNRADLWVEEIWNKGLVDEVKNLIKLGFKDSSKLKGLVYKSVLQFLEPSNTLSEQQIKQLIKYDIHAYIRRQLTYFKRNKDIVWFDISSGEYIKNIYNLVNG